MSSDLASPRVGGDARRLIVEAPIASRTDIINLLVRCFGFQRYLELGLGDPSLNFERIVAPDRHSVDPHAAATFRVPSDEFFGSGLGHDRYDVVFIDGMHEFQQCLRDIENAVARLSPLGFVVVHDANPPTEWHQRPPHEAGYGDWNGTVWKAIVAFRRRHPEIWLRTVDVDWGCVVLCPARGEREAAHALALPDVDALTWSGLEQNRAAWLNLISVEDFRRELSAEARRMPSVAIVLGTYNRRAHLESAVASIRQAVGSLPYQIVAVDGGSGDGSREWLAAQHDVVLIGQRGPLTGAVRAFNLGFAYAVDHGFDYVCHFNDDATFASEQAIARAVGILERDRAIGEVAFAFDLYGGWRHDHIHDKPYANFGVIRREAGMAVAVAQGDPQGRLWWNPLYKTYGADCEFGCWLWKLGWPVHAASELRVHDLNVNDELRAANGGHDPNRADSVSFWQRWPTAAQLAPITVAETK